MSQLAKIFNYYPEELTLRGGVDVDVSDEVFDRINDLLEDERLCQLCFKHFGLCFLSSTTESSKSNNYIKRLAARPIQKTIDQTAAKLTFKL